MITADSVLGRFQRTHQAIKAAQERLSSGYGTYPTPPADSTYAEDNPEYMMIPAGESSYGYRTHFNRGVN